MKALKSIGIVILVLIVVVLVISFFLPSKFEAENSVEINAPAWTAFEEVNTLSNWNNWEPWTLSDPTTKVTYDGPESGVGSTRFWNGEKTKTGKTIIVESVANESLKTELYFGKSDKPSNGFWKFEETDEGTKVTWGFSSDVGFNPIAKIFMAFGMKGMNESFKEGLENIKKLAEEKPLTPKVEILIKDMAAQKFIGVREWVATPDFQEYFTRTYGQIGMFCGKNGIEPKGMPVAIYHGMTEAMDSFDTEAAFPVAFETDVELGEGLSYVEIPEGRLVSAIHYGPYNTVNSTWEAVMIYIKENELEENGPSYEAYLNDPATVEESEIMTQICVPVK